MKKRLLLYIDFLGFSELVKSQSLKESLKFYRRTLIEYEFLKIEKKYDINFEIISDSIFIWIESPDNYRAAIKLFAIASKISSQSIIKKRPIRGAIIFDEFKIGEKKFKIIKSEIKSHLILGKGIISGHRWEQIQEWIGISVNPICIEEINKEFRGLFTELNDLKLLAEYNIPTKHGLIKSYAINSFYQSHFLGKYKTKNDVTIINKSYSDAFSELKSTTYDFNILSKITNTEIFYNYITSHNLIINDLIE